MKIIQIQFTGPDDFIAADNPVRIVDAFVEKLNLAGLKNGWNNSFTPTIY